MIKNEEESQVIIYYVHKYQFCKNAIPYPLRPLHKNENIKETKK